MMHSRRTLLLSLIVAALLPSRSALADSSILEPPSTRVILEVQGAIDRTTDGRRALFDFDQLEALGIVQIQTESPWTDGMTSFQGVPISALVEHLGARGTEIRFLALDDYTVTIPISDLEAYQPILATRRDGAPMRIRDKGPIWVIYPWSDHPEIQNEPYYSKAIWQVFRMTFE